MEGDAIILSHCILLICATTFFWWISVLCIYNIVYWRGSTSRKHLYL